MKYARNISVMAAFVGFALLAGCAAGPDVRTDGPAVHAPAYRVGDRWLYTARDGFRVPVVWEEVHEVIAIRPEAIIVRVTQRGPNVNTDRVEEWSAPGLVRKGAVADDETLDFKQPFARYAFPMQPGQTWREWLDNVNEKTGRRGQISRWVSVVGWGEVATPAGVFDALKLRVSMRLNDDEFWRTATEASYVVWYSPAVRAAVREEKDAQYYEKGDRHPMAMRSQQTVIELVSFKPGA